MPSNQPGQPNPAWKNSPAAPAKPAGGQRAWQQTSTAAAPAAGRWSRKSKIAAALLSLAVVFALVVVVINLLAVPRPACLVLMGAVYDDNLAVPHNAYGWKGLEDLSAVADKEGLVSSWLPWGRSGRLRLHHGPERLEGNGSWQNAWARIPQHVEEKTLVVFLALHGGADGRQPYLIEDDPTGQARLSVERVLAALDGPDLVDKNRVLILDATQVTAHWPSGMLHNDFARKLQALKGRIEQNPRLFVLCASGVDQHSWVSEEWQQTIFTHYVIEGLKGAADRDGNGRVTLGELSQYVKDKVRKWTETNRNAQQEPVLLGDDNLAQEVELVQIDQPYQERSPEQAPGIGSFPREQELQGDWEKCQALRSQEVPGPEVYSPHLWRRYQDTLLRREQLLLRGDPTHKAAALKDRLTTLAKQIQQARSPELAQTALANTLSMPAALGVALPWPAAELRSRCSSLWMVPEAELTKQWQQLKNWAAKDGPLTEPQKQLLKVSLGKAALEEVRKAPAPSLPQLRDRLEKANKVLEMARGDLGPLRPAEVHYLVMLRRDCDFDATPAPSPADLLMAVSVRALAEEAALAVRDDAAGHPSSEIVFPWIKEQVEKADSVRRLGEDWLFGSDQRAWDKARLSLQEARAKYEEALKDAEVVRTALATRNRVLAALLYFAQWAARFQPGADNREEEKKADARRAEIEALGRSVDALVVRLNAPTSAGKVLDRASLEGPTVELDKRLQALQRAFATECDALRDVDQQKYWHAIENVLSVPLIEDASLRLKLLRADRRISGKLHRGDLRFAGRQLDPGELSRQAREGAQGQGRMALAVAGEPWLGDRRRADIADSVARATPEGWPETFARVGEDLGMHWQRMSAEIKKRQEASIVKGDLQKATDDLKPAEEFCRLVPGSAVAAIPANPFDPVEGMRRLRLHDLLLWQAERTLADHWYSDSDNPKDTYYEPAARAFLKDARRLAEVRPETADLNKERQERVRKMEAQVHPAAVIAEGVVSQHVTSEQQFKVAWKLRGEPGVPPGIPMVRLEGSGPLRDLKAKQYLARSPIEEALPQEKTYTLESTLWNDKTDPPLVPKVQAGQARLRGLYRGQRIEADTALQIHQSAEIIAYHYPAPPEARIAVRMGKDFHYGALSIVLDLSGSMSLPVEGQDGKTKIALALTALDEVLKKVPRGTYLSLFVFGQKTGPDNRKPETKQTKIMRVRRCTPWNPKELKDLMDELAALRPMNETPLAESLMVAGTGGFPAGYTGPKVLLVLTDGMDTMFKYGNFAGDENLHDRHRTKSIPEFLRAEFTKNSGIEVNLVFFVADQDELKEAKAQFSVVKELNPPGKLEIVPHPAKLRETLENALRPRLLLYEGAGSSLAKGFPVEGLLVTRGGENLRWQTVPSGDYESRIRNADRQGIHLGNGDNLLITLKRQGDQVVYERTLFSEEARKKFLVRGTHEAKVVDTWLVDVLRNRIDDEGMLDQLITIEDQANLTGADRVQLRHLQPGFVWLEVKGKDGKVPAGIRWHNEAGYPAPAYRLEAGTWPSGADERPEVSVWCIRQPYPDEAMCRLLERHPDKSLQADFGNGRKVTVPGGAVIIEKVSSEQRYVSVAPGKPREMEQCLVLRMAYQGTRPVWAQLLGQDGNAGGAEHQFFTSAGRCTAIFWGAADYERSRFSLNLVPLDAFTSAVPSAHLSLDAPSPTDAGPPRVDD